MKHHRFSSLPAPVASAMIAVSLAACLLAGCSSRLTVEQADARVREALIKAAKGHPDRAGASILVHSDALGIHSLVRADPGGPDAFHAASIGKTFTAVLIGTLIDAGRLELGSRVAPLLEPGLLDGLYVVDGRDHQGEVTVGQLLAHTSGAADYFADRGSGGKAVSDLLIEQPGRVWTPRELLDFTRREQRAIGLPGTVFHYSDTGYIILGLLAENLSGMPFERLLARDIFEPLGMDRTWMPFRSRPRTGEAEPIRAAWLGGAEVSRYPSITADWAGGGIASTEEDLFLFQKALWAGRLVSDKTLAEMQTFDHVFRKGIRYGKGLMQLRFGEFFFLLKGYPVMTGHMGVLATHLFSDPSRGLHIVVTLGSDAAMEDSVKLIIQVLGVLLRTG